MHNRLILAGIFWGNAMLARLSVALFAATALAAPALAGPLSGAAPAKTVAFEEDVHGVRISDPYRWMEGDDPDFRPWLKSQADAADAWLAALPTRAKLLEGIAARSGTVESVGNIQRRGGRTFLARRAAAAQTSSLMVRDGTGGAERLLFDPASLDTAERKGHAINYWEASPDGRHVYLGVSADGSEEATLRVLDVATGKAVDGEVIKALFNGGGSESGGIYPQWLPDGSGFFYNALPPEANAGAADYYLNSRLFFHRLGTPTSQDRRIARGVAGDPVMKDAEIPVMTVQPGSDTAMLLLLDGVDRAARIHVAPVADVVAGRAKWVPVGSRDNRILGAVHRGRDLFLLLKDDPMGRVVVLHGGETDIARAEQVVPAGKAPLDQIFLTRDGLYLACRGAEGAELRLLRADGSIAPVPMPFPGASYIFDASGTDDGLLVSLENYVTPRTRLLVKGTTATDTGLGPKVAYAVDAYVMETVMVPARDGTRVPLDIVRRKDLPRDGKRPVLLEAYGAYGINVDPYFNPRVFALLDAGAIYAVAHTRGGGEFGDAWWRGGYQATKPNTWRDAIDSGEWLNRSGWTSGRRTVLWGTSAGGIMVGMGVAERPDLWAGGIASVGVMNPMRFEFSPNGKTNIAEFGTVATAAGAKALHAMDAYHALKPGTAYPPMLVTAGANDPRVIAWQPAKFAARLQTMPKSGPVIFRTDFDQGHGMGSMRSQLDAAAADLGAFTLWAAAQAK